MDISTKKCITCPQNCYQCEKDSQNKLICLKCAKDSFKILVDGKLKCVKCPILCMNCLENVDNWFKINNFKLK